MTLIRSITTVGNFTIVSRILGFIRDLLMASFIGAGPVMDALVVAIKIPSFFRRLFAEGAFNAAFVPLFSGVLSTQGKEEAKTYAEEIMSFLIAVLIGLIIVVEIFTPFCMSIFVYGFKSTPERLHLTIEYTRITFPYLLVISLTALYSGILNSLDRFVAAASSQAAGNAFIVGVLLLAGIGGTGDLKWAGGIVATAILFSGIVQLIWVLHPTHKQGVRLRLLRPRLTPRVKKFLKKMIPGAVGSGVVQINLFIGTLIASFLPEGGVSFLYYADRLNQLPLSVIGTAISTALLPLMSRQLRKGESKAAVHNQNRALEFGLLLVLPATLGLILAAHPFISVLFERGKFTEYDAYQTALTLMGYASGLPAYILVKIFATSFFARQDTMTPVKIATLAVAVDIILSIVLFFPLKHVGIALATAGASWINAFVLGYILYRQGLLHRDYRLKRFLPRLFIATIVSAIVVFFAVQETTALLMQGVFWRVSSLLIIVGAGLISFFGIIIITKAVNFTELWSKHPPKHEVPLP